MLEQMENHYHKRAEFDRIMARVAFNQQELGDVEWLRQEFNRLFVAWQKLQEIEKVLQHKSLTPEIATSVTDNG